MAFAALSVLQAEQFPLKKAVIARHWGKSRAYLTLLGKPVESGGKGMPEFTSLADADAWRAVHAPARHARFAGEQSSSENPTHLRKNTADSTGTTTNISQKSGGADRAGVGVMDLVDIASMVRDDEDFDALMIRQAQRVPQIAYGLLERAASTARPDWISAATKNWQESARAAADVRTRFIDVQERARILITIDEVMDVVGTELQAIRTALEKLGSKYSALANPAEPDRAQAVIDAAVDEILHRFQLTTERTRRELAAPAA